MIGWAEELQMRKVGFHSDIPQFLFTEARRVPSTPLTMNKEDYPRL